MRITEGSLEQELDAANLIAANAMGLYKARDPEEHGDVKLSIQASQYNYCEPRVNGLPLDGYETVEIAIISDEHGMCHPSKIGIEGFDDLFEVGGDNPVAGYVSQAKVAELRAALQARYEKSHRS